MSETFTIKLAEGSNPAPVLHLSGRLEAAGAQQLIDEANKLVESGEKYLVLDLSEVEFLASSGLGALLLLTETFRDHDGELVLSALPLAVREVITLLNLNEFLEIKETVTDAFETVTV